MSENILACSSPSRRTPGGIFLSLVRKNSTEEEKKEIFRRDKMITASRLKKLKQRRRANYKQHRNAITNQKTLQEKAEEQLQIFRAQLDPSSFMHLPVIPGNRKDRNMHKRYCRNGKEPSSQEREVEERRSVFERLGNKESNTSEQTEAMEIDPGSRSDQVSKRRNQEQIDREAILIQTEKKLAEEFEETKDFNLDCGFELS